MKSGQNNKLEANTSPPVILKTFVRQHVILVPKKIK
jgi:hypothetical protein